MSYLRVMRVMRPMYNIRKKKLAVRFLNPLYPSRNICGRPRRSSGAITKNAKYRHKKRRKSIVSTIFTRTSNPGTLHTYPQFTVVLTHIFWFCTRHFVGQLFFYLRQTVFKRRYFTNRFHYASFNNVNGGQLASNKSTALFKKQLGNALKLNRNKTDFASLRNLSPKSTRRRSISMFRVRSNKCQQ